MKSLIRRVGLTHIVLASGILFLAGCIQKPPVVEPPKPPHPTCEEKKGWMKKTPYFENENIFEAKGVANPSPNFQKMRDDAIENAKNTLAGLWETRISSYSENFTHEYQDWMGGGIKSDVLYDQLRKASIDNTVNRLKMDECEDETTGRYWVYVYISTASIEAANREAALGFQEYLAEERKEEFRRIMNEQINEWNKKDKEILDSLPDIE